MNVFQKYTRKSLAKNRTRTLVTVIGIVLSMALFTAVTEGAFSGLQFLIRAEEDNNGAFHAAVSDLTDGELQSLQNEQEIDRLDVWQEVGWAEIESNASGSMPYLIVMDTRNQTDLAAVHLVEGRMPENETELLFPEHLNHYRDAAVQVGDELTLTVGLRTVDGERAKLRDPYAWESEELADPKEITYTVVGIYGRLAKEIEPYECPGYLALTLGGGRGSSLALFTVKHPARAFDFLPTLQNFGGSVQPHQYLLAFYGGVRGNLSQVLYGLATILVLLIAFGSVSLIYNSFSISVSERTKQIGILKSVGATRKQIRGSVLYEALLLCAISIPIGLALGCVGIGLTLYLLRDGFKMLVENGSRVQMRLVLSAPALGISVAVCLLTTLISAWIPAVRAVRVSPMQAIRQSEDVKLSRRDVRSSKLTQKLFGFPGTMAAKNFRRNRKRYRSTVISLFLSVVLFIAASSFCAYLTDAVNDVAVDGTVEADLMYYAGESVTPVEAEQRLSLMMNVEHVLSGVYYAATGGPMCYPAEAVSTVSKNSERAYVHDGVLEHETLLVFLQDAEFTKLCEENGLNAADYFHGDAPLALVKNHVVSRYYTEEGARWEEYELVRPDSLPLTVTLETTRYTLDGGWQLMDNDGEHYVYYPEDYLEEYWSTQQNGDRLDSSKAKILTKDEAVSEQYFTAGALLNKAPDFLSGDTRPALIYPYSLRTSVLPADKDDCYDTYLFMTDDHAAAFAAMQQTLKSANLSTDQLYDHAETSQSERMLVTIVDVFSYGFIILISLIAAANVFNTVSTSISLRRRELAMLESIGLGRKDFYRMMNYECLIYGGKALLWGLPAAGLVTYGIYRVVGGAISRGFYVPWYSVVIAVGSVFLVVFATMLYAAEKIRKQNPIDALKLETL